MSPAGRGSRWASMVAFSVGQCLITLALYLVCGVLSLLSIPLTGSYGYAITGPVAFALYAVIWGGIWYASYRNSGMQHFTPKLAAATLPLVALTAVYVLRHPRPDYRPMIPILPQDIHFHFAAAITVTLLFPWYAMVWKRNLASSRRAAQFSALMIPSVIAGTLCFTACSMILPANW